MAKIHPFTPINSSCSSSYVTAKKEKLTVWMKSLVMQGNGCTVFNENGQIVYRVDNYDKKKCNEVYLMDLKGKVLFTIGRIRKLCLSRQYNGYKCDVSELKNQMPFFQARKNRGLFQEDLSFEVTFQSCNGESCCYRLQGPVGKSEFKIADNNKQLVAEAKRKELSPGVFLGDDVLNLTMEAHVDQSLIVALMVVYGLMHNRL